MGWVGGTGMVGWFGKPGLGMTDATEDCGGGVTVGTATVVGIKVGHPTAAEVGLQVYICW